LAIVVGLPAPRPGLPDAIGRSMLAALEASVPVHFDLLEQQAYLLGHVAGLVAVENSCRLIQQGVVDLCLAGGVESYIDRVTLEWLDWTWQLHARTHPWGFVPGEGAGFCVLASDRYVAAAGLPVLGAVLSATTVQEEKLRRDHKVCIGEALTDSVRRTLAHLPPSTKVDQTICDLNGQTHRADEFGFTVTRLGAHFVDPGRFLTPADCWGDVGAASGPLYIALAINAGQRGYASGPNTLLMTSAMVAERSSALLHANPST
jgi:3-oxoacyl-[acyl-carrier-protein] synthase-1